MIAVTVIMPVLNGASTIGRALESLFAQTMGDFEVIVVNDGSVDQTGTIVQAVAMKDARVRYIELDRNHGVSHARNIALDQAQGAWVTSLDADDWFDEDRLEVMLAAVNELEADIVLDNLRIIHQTSGHVKGETCFGRSRRIERLTLKQLFERDTPFSTFAIGYAQPLLRTSFLRHKGIRYGEAYALGEDFVFLAQAMLHGAQAYILPYTGYNYTYMRQPLFSSKEVAHKANRGYQQVIEANDRLLDEFAPTITSVVRSAILRRKRLFKALSIAHEIKGLAHKRAWRQVLAQTLHHPAVVPFVARLLVLRLFSPDFTNL